MTARAPALSGDLGRAIASWTEQDPDPQTRRQLDDLAKAANSGDARAMAELVDAFSSRLQFGTAGLRGALGPGPNRMNRVVVGQAAAGLANYLIDHGLTGGKVIIGFDARHNSDVFARDTAEIMAGAGFQTMITTGPVPTPLVPFGIRHFGCVAGVVVTASHNPPQDNGYKVYLGDGSQIVPPADAEISARIDEVATHSPDDVPRSQSYEVLGEELQTAYLDRVASPGTARMRRAKCAGSTRHCMAWALRWSKGRSRLAGFLLLIWWPSRPARIRSFRPWRSRIRRNLAPSTLLWHRRKRSMPIWLWRTIRMPTVVRLR